MWQYSLSCLEHVKHAVERLRMRTNNSVCCPQHRYENSMGLMQNLHILDHITNIISTLWNGTNISKGHQGSLRCTKTRRLKHLLLVAQIAHDCLRPFFLFISLNTFMSTDVTGLKHIFPATSGRHVSKHNHGMSTILENLCSYLSHSGNRYQYISRTLMSNSLKKCPIHEMWDSASFKWQCQLTFFSNCQLPHPL